MAASSLPPSLGDFLAAETVLEPYRLSAHINPYYLQGDFDGDSRTDTAVLVRQKATGKAGVLIVHGVTGLSFVLGAGQHFGNGGDDFSWMDAWRVYPRGPVGMGADETDPPLLRGDALMVIKTESASAIVIWTGTEYAWYQQGD